MKISALSSQSSFETAKVVVSALTRSALAVALLATGFFAACAAATGKLILTTALYGVLAGYNAYQVHPKLPDTAASLPFWFAVAGPIFPLYEMYRFVHLKERV